MNNGRIDCFLIGNNQMNFEEYERQVRSMGEKSGAYRDLNLNFIRVNNRACTLMDIFNLNYIPGNDSMGKMGFGNNFSATIAYLGTFLNKRGLSFDYVNSFQDEKEYLAKKLLEGSIDVVAITTTLYISILPIVEIINFIRKYNKSVKIIIGGPFIATQMKVQEELPLQYLFDKLNADFYINSPQGEAALARIIHALKNKGMFYHIPNIVFRQDGQYIVNENVPEDNLLEENTVNWGLFESRLTKLAPVRTAISCPFSCAFCGFPQHAGKYQSISVDAISKELKQISSLHAVSSINFIDDTFNFPPARFKEILKMLIREKIKFKWNSHFRCQFADEEVIALMKESGCEGVFLGIESGSQQILNNMNKHSSIEDYIKGIELLKNYEIITYASFIIGFPGETKDTVNETIGFIEETKPDFFRTQLWYYDLITPISKYKDKYGIRNSQFEWAHNTMDAAEASDLIEQNFLNIRHSIWLPQNDFDYPGIFNLLNRGWSLERIKDFISVFNEGVKEKLPSSHNKNTSLLVLEKLQSICTYQKSSDCINVLEPSKSGSLRADFNF